MRPEAIALPPPTVENVMNFARTGQAKQARMKMTRPTNMFCTPWPSAIAPKPMAKQSTIIGFMRIRAIRALRAFGHHSCVESESCPANTTGMVATRIMIPA